MNPNEFEIIDWYDHCSENDSGWRDADQYKNRLQMCRSAGWVVAENDLALTIVGHGPASKDDTQTYSGDICILKAAIVNRKKVILETE
jgi:hypothetical protein